MHAESFWSQTVKEGVEKKSSVLMLVSNEFLDDPRVRAEAFALARKNWNIHIIAWDRLREHGDVKQEEGITVTWSKVRSGIEIGLRQALRLPIFWLDALWKACQLKIDIVHCHDLDTLPAGYLIARLKRARLIYDAHESYPDQQVGRIPEWAVFALNQLENCLLKVTTSRIWFSTSRV